MAWLNEDLERPSRSDWYLMQIAAEVARTKVKDPSSVRLSDMKLKADHSEEVRRAVTCEEASVRSRSRWYGFLGVK